MSNNLLVRVNVLEALCAEMYQVAGAVGTPERILDQLSAAANGKPLPHESVLPFDASECTPLPSVAGAALGRRNKGVTSPAKAKAARRNGKLHGGRPAKFHPGDVVRVKAIAPADLRGLVGKIVRRGSERALFYVRFKTSKTAAPVRTWWMEKTDEQATGR